MKSQEAKEFFRKHGIDLKVTTTYNPAANGKVERGHAPMVNALVKACRGQKAQWPNLFPLALLADRTTMSIVTGFAPTEIINGHLLLMPIESSVTTWRIIGWQDQVSREGLLQKRIELFSQTPEKIEAAVERI